MGDASFMPPLVTSSLASPASVAAPPAGKSDFAPATAPIAAAPTAAVPMNCLLDSFVSLIDSAVNSFHWCSWDFVGHLKRRNLLHEVARKCTQGKVVDHRHPQCILGTTCVRDASGKAPRPISLGAPAVLQRRPGVWTVLDYLTRIPARSVVDRRPTTFPSSITTSLCTPCFTMSLAASETGASG